MVGLAYRAPVTWTPDHFIKVVCEMPETLKDSVGLIASHIFDKSRLGLKPTDRWRDTTPDGLRDSKYVLKGIRGSKCEPIYEHRDAEGGITKSGYVIKVPLSDILNPLTEPWLNKKCLFGQIKMWGEAAGRFAKLAQALFLLADCAALAGLCKSYGSPIRSFFLLIKGVHYLLYPTWRTDDTKLQNYYFKIVCPSLMTLVGYLGVCKTAHLVSKWFVATKVGGALATWAGSFTSVQKMVQVGHWLKLTTYLKALGIDYRFFGSVVRPLLGWNATAFMVVNIAVYKYRLWHYNPALDGRAVDQDQKELVGHVNDFIKYIGDTLGGTRSLMGDAFPIGDTAFTTIDLVSRTCNLGKSLREIESWWYQPPKSPGRPKPPEYFDFAVRFYRKLPTIFSAA